MRKHQSQVNFQFGGTMTNFNSTITSNQSNGKLIPISGFDTQQYNTNNPDDQHHLTISGDYDTLIMSSNNATLKNMTRTASQGRIVSQ
jgi:hypothetical protein